MSTTSMTVQDALWLTMDRPNNLMVVDGSMVLRGTPDREAVRAIMQDAVDRFPVLARKPVKSGLGWAWQDDPVFDLDSHIHVVEVDPGTGLDDLQQFMAEQRSVPLPKDRPLWVTFLLTPLTLSDGTQGSAIVTRFHHAIADGVRLTQVLLGLCEAQEGTVAAAVARSGVQSVDGGSAAEEIGRVVSHSAEGVVRAVETGVADATGAAVRATRHPLSALGHLPGRAAEVVRAGAHQVDEGMSLLRHPDRLLDALEVLGAEQHRSLNDLSSVVKLALADSDDTVWTGKPGTVKVVDWSDPIPLDLVKGIGRAAGATVNDVLLSAVAGALRRYLADQGESVREVAWMVPVNLKPFEDNLPPDLGNYFALVILPMVLDEPDRAARLEQVHHRMQRIKHSDEAVLTFGLQRVVSMSPGQIAYFLTNFFANKAVGVLTNVPGPTGLLRFAGVDVHQVVGFAPCSGNQPMTATIFSYNGGVTVGFASDAGLIPEPGKVVSYVIDEVRAMAQETGVG